MEMKLIVVLLAVGLSASEKLNRGYLPPPGAKLAGGSSGDLLTPLEYQDKPIYRSENGGNYLIRESETRPDFANGISTNMDANMKTIAMGDEGSSTTTAETLFNTNNIVYPNNGFITSTPLISKTEYNAYTQNSSPGFRYSIKENPIQQQVLDSFGANGKPENISIIAVTTDIMNKYHPKAFGMYGGNPMIINTYSPQDKLNKMIVDHDGNNLNYLSSDRLTGESYVPVSQKSKFIVTPMTNNFNSNSKVYQPAPAKPVKTESEGIIPVNFDQKNQAQKYFQRRPERPQAESERNAVILSYENVITPDKYSYSFDTSNGIRMDESATLVDGVKASGSYSYTGDDGKVYSVIYSADENGFQPRGDHLPKPPPIPKAIQKVIDQANRDKEAGIVHDGSYNEEKYGHMKYQGPVNRYLQNMQENPQLKNRNLVLVPKQTYRQPEIMKSIKSKDDKLNGNTVQQLDNIFQSPLINSNGQLPTRNFSPADRTKANPIQIMNRQNIINYSRPVTYLGQQDNLNLMPITTKYDKQLKNTLKTKLVQSPSSSINKVTNNFGLTDKIPASNFNLSLAGINKTGPYKMTTLQDAGYYYVPPRRIFVEGRYQDQSPVLTESQNQFGETEENVATKSIPVYYINQRDNNPSKTTSYFTNTQDLDQNQQPYEGNFYESNNMDDNRPINDFKIASTPTSNGIAVTITTPKPYVSTQITSSYDTENTKDIDYQEKNIFPEQRDENGVPLTRMGYTDLSTTQMPSELKYTNSLSDSNLYETSNPIEFDTATNFAKDSEDKGYFGTKPEVPATFEDFPSSTNTPTFTGFGIQTEPIPNIKVDGFGRPIQDTYYKTNNAPNYGYTTGIPMKDKSIDDKPKPTATYYSYEDKITFPKVDVVLEASDNLGLEPETAKTGFDKLTGKIIGEDFSGPKQPQRYDPETGYFY